MSKNDKIDKAFSEVVSYHSSIPMITKDYFCAGAKYGIDQAIPVTYDIAFNNGVDVALSELKRCSSSGDFDLLSGLLLNVTIKLESVKK